MPQSINSSLRNDVLELYCKNGQTLSSVATKLKISKELVGLIITESSKMVSVKCDESVALSSSSKHCKPLKCATCPILSVCQK